MKLYVEKRLSKSGSPYVALIVDFGYAKRILTMDKGVISEILNVKLSEVECLELDKPVYITLK